MSGIGFLLTLLAAAVPVALFFSMVRGRKGHALPPGHNHPKSTATPPADFGLSREEHGKVGGDEGADDKGAAAAAAAGGALIIGYEVTRQHGEAGAEKEK